jgi:Fe-S-cluster containining protein
VSWDDNLLSQNFKPLQYDPILEKASLKKKEYTSLISFLKKKKPSDLDVKVREFHDAAFEKIDCLLCANCCSSISPALYDKDIDRLAKFLKTKPSKVVEAYLQQDEDKDWVFRKTPCPFLVEENLCAVYESRPLACKEYPHTNRARFYQLLDLSLKNASICPAVCLVIEELSGFYSGRK